MAQNIVCPKCGETTAQCFHSDLHLSSSSSGLAVDYRLVCGKCRHIERKHVEVDENAKAGICPFCHIEHEYRGKKERLPMVFYCSNCHQPTATCFFDEDRGGAAIDDWYTLRCSGCGHVEEDHAYMGYPGWTVAEESSCPFCGESVRTHVTVSLVHVMDQLVCPKCGGEAKCFHDGDVGAGNRFIDQYRLECSHCGHKESTHVDGGDSGWNDHFTDCPYCGARGPM